MNTDATRAAMTPDLIALWGKAVPGMRPMGAPSRPNLSSEIEQAVAQVCYGMGRYKEIEGLTGVPWYVVGVLHLMECSCRWDQHLANGDPLTARTVNAPEGLPPEGRPPFSWRDSALAVFKAKGWDLAHVLKLPDGQPDWTLGTLLWRIEAWNGVGYRRRGIPSPYLWAGTSQEQPGRYIADHVWDSTKWSAQVGAAAVLKTMVQRKIIAIAGDEPPPEDHDVSIAA